MVLKLQRDTCSKPHDITKGIAALKVSAEDYRSTADRMELVLGNVEYLADPSQRLSEIQESVGSIERQLTDSLDREILDWLSSERGQGRHHEVQSRRTPGTGKWILSTPAFQTWLNNAYPERLLWIVGAPRCGKSTLVSLIVDELKVLQASDNAPIAYYYSSHPSSHRTSPESFVSPSMKAAPSP
ncbi:uncharacterized protein ASPGLDRAFT_587411 [Aspergillus glaucus CBS 516.65]|uniref:Nephrocystin 3-like N-terminal domain-containing protein n=1 Tax=Aspergillus glaucus CBS 516.65 TaxID=1160497 RepID=A0A1L9VCW7_ASPGL|nr:hypothetical protein ASPGLDRAFT_587411 [Aspergillus glaucus CBS 516.65]OJJ81754.1 hypothetical protein ASPGLDRAFT_587411 [Aspergillus glaucus CBS 516.65]